MELPEAKLQAKADSKAEDWQIAINDARKHYKATGVYTDGSISKEGAVGTGRYIESGKKMGGVTWPRYGMGRCAG